LEYINDEDACMGIAMSDSHVGIMMVGASLGEFEASISRSGWFCIHSLLAHQRGIQTLIIAVNKMDDPCYQKAWNYDRWLEIKSETTRYLTKIGWDMKLVTTTYTHAPTSINSLPYIAHYNFVNLYLDLNDRYNIFRYHVKRVRIF
jgi:translation elongation factor EF-1alpha